MHSDIEPSVARELYPLTVRQARNQVLIELFTLAALGAFIAIVASSTLRLCFAFTFFVGAAATVRDVRWWLWVRRADPVDAYSRLQRRAEWDAHPSSGV
jgi:hypothetical protein